MESTTLATLLLGFALGLEHALDPDHVVAISAILSHNRHPLKAALTGAFWGIGHTATLLLTGLAVIIFKLTIPYKLSLSMEFLVGVVLFMLGAQLLWKYNREKIHTHHHAHSVEIPEHQHLHSHADRVGHEHKHQTHHYRSLVVGMIHGLAGSAALMLLVLSSIQSPTEGVAYILLFGIGSILGMIVVSTLIGLTYLLSSLRFASLNHAFRLTAGAVSVALGIMVMIYIGFIQGLIY